MAQQTSADESIDVEFRDRELWTITIPRSGPPHTKIRGVRMFTIELEPAIGDQLEARLRKHNPRVRGGRPRIYRGDRELDPPSGADDIVEDEAEVRAESVAVASSPAEAAQANVAVLQATIRGLERAAELAAKELETIRARRDKEVAATQATLEQVVAGYRRQIAEATAHAESQLRAAWTLDGDAQDFRLKAMAQQGESLLQIIEMRRAADSLAAKDGFAEILKSGKELLEGVFETPVGRAIGLQISGAVSSRVAKMMDIDDVSSRDAILAMTLEGSRYRERSGSVRRVAAIRPKCPVAQGALLALQVAHGEADIKALVDLCEAHADAP